MRLFYSYSHRDEVLRAELETHLAILTRQGLLESWHDRQIVPGSDWRKAIEDNLTHAQIVLLLISADFLASDYCYSVEVQSALERHYQKEAIVIPVILRACDWKSSPIASLQGLPRDGKPITSWANRDEAWTDVALGIRRSILDLHSAKNSEPATTDRSTASRPATPAIITRNLSIFDRILLTFISKERRTARRNPVPADPASPFSIVEFLVDMPDNVKLPLSFIFFIAFFITLLTLPQFCNL